VKNKYRTLLQPLSLVLLLCWCVSGRTAVAAPGDVTDDNQVGLADAVYSLQLAAGMVSQYQDL